MDTRAVGGWLLGGFILAGVTGCDQEGAKAVDACRWGIVHHLKQDKWEEGLAEYNSALKLRPRFPGALLGRALVLQDKQQINEAMADYALAIEIAPDFSWAYFYRAALHDKMGAGADRDRDATKAYELNPALKSMVLGDRAPLQDKKTDVCLVKGKG